MNKNILKRILVVLLAVFLIFSFASCSVIDSVLGGGSSVSQADDDDDDDDKKKSKKKNEGSENAAEADDIITVIDRGCVASAVLEMDKLSETGMNIAAYTFTTVHADIDTVATDYNKHLTDELGINYRHEALDIDGDGEAEALFLINSFDYNWAGKFNIEDDGFCLETGAFNGDGMLLVYCDFDGTQTQIESFYRDNQSFTENAKANFDNGILNIYPDGTTAEQLSFPLSVHADDPAELLKRALENEGLRNIKYFEADVCDAEGNEYIFVYNNYCVSVYTLQGSKLYMISELDKATENAIYVAQKGSAGYILNYMQDSDYAAYTAYRFDDSFTYTECDVYDSNSSDFYDKLNAYLSSAIACANIYSPSNEYETVDDGFASMTMIGDFEFKNSAMVTTGTVNVPSFLFLRSGPGKSYEQILTDYSNKESYIKLTDGMEVEIIGYENTGDDENPVWLKVSVTYNGEKYEGYCSKEWVKFEGVASLRVGDTYNLNTTVDDKALTWKCSDPSLASVDAEGVVTGLKKGMVIVTAATSTGAEISCYAIVC